MVILSKQAEVVANKRYFQKDDDNNTIEDSDGLFHRVAKHVASADSRYGTLGVEIEMTTGDFLDMMSNLEFIPNSPTLMNAGTGQGTLSACFVLPISDSMEGIMKAATDSAMVQKFGGGTGFSLSLLRPRGSSIKSTHGIACGPIEVLKTLSRVSSMITQGGKRDGANMAVMSVYHPDIREFISCKQTEGDLHNFNISVGVDSNFMSAAEAGVTYPLIDPHTKKVTGYESASDILDIIIDGAWKNGEPGVVFLDRINEDNKVIAAHGEMIATNPCGEQPLLPNESCNLGSINLSRFYIDGNESNWRGNIDWDRLAVVTRQSVHFLDNIIDINEYATPEIKEQTRATRKIGLGIMGFADLLIQLRIAYNSKLGREVGEGLIQFIREIADDESIELGKARGTFPSWKESTYESNEPYRNACRLTVAPTGTISMLADCSSGVEPIFALAYRKGNILEGETLYYINRNFESDARENGFYSDSLMEHLSNGGSLHTRLEVPTWVKEVYVTAPDISPLDHVEMQSVFQNHIDSGISKTINFNNEATKDDVRTAYMSAWRTGCKGITVYRAGSRDKEVLISGTIAEKTDQLSIIEVEVGVQALSNANAETLISNSVAPSDEPCCDDPFIIHENGCWTCKNCSFGKCDI